MKSQYILIYSLLALCAAPVSASAQASLGDKESRTVDLGYGFESTEFLTTAAIQTITSDELSHSPAISLADALYGRLAGLTAIQKTGFKGEENTGAAFNIRGVQTTSDNGILILVDGIERPIDRLKVEEVESVAVLKDAASVALYGHEGVNGVLLVKTKRGRAGSGSHFKAGVSHKFQFDPQPAEMVSAYDYANAVNSARVNDGLPVLYSDAELDIFSLAEENKCYPNVNWKSLMTNNSAHETDAFVSAYGGTQKVQYFTQLDYTDARGLCGNATPGDCNSRLKYSKANVRANLDFQVSSSTRVKADVLALFMETNGVPGLGSNEVWSYLYTVPALSSPIRTAGGTWGGNPEFGGLNPYARIQESGCSKTHQSQIWTDVTLEQDLFFLLKGLQFYAGGSYDSASSTVESHSRELSYGWNYYNSYGELDEVTIASADDTFRSVRYLDWQWSAWTLNAGFKYSTQLGNGDHIGANANYNVKSRTLDGINNVRYRRNVNLAFHYDHARKFMADLVLAANGSNRCRPAKWAFSPTLGLGWVYADRPEAPFLNYGKLRLSGGIQHSDYLPGEALWLPATMDFRQEAAYKANLGTDLRIANCLDFSLDLFYQQRRNILVSDEALYPALSGLPSSFDDRGRVSNHGVEIALRYAKTFGNGFNLHFGGSLAAVRSKVLEWIENPVSPNLSVVGTPVGASRGLVALGLFRNQEEIDANPVQQFGPVQPGDIRYEDVNGDGVVNENDYVAMDFGGAFPSLNYALDLGFEYKGFGINATFQGAGDQMKDLQAVTGVWGVLPAGKNLSSEYYRNCYDVAGENAAYPRLSTVNAGNNTRNSTFWYRNVKWFKMRDCEIYYRLPASVLRRAKMSDVKLFVQGENLLSFDNVPVMDAENLNTGYPVMKAVNIGLSVVF